MTDKTQLVNIQKYLMGQPIDIINDDDGEYYLSTESALELAQQILDICQPQWIYTNDLQPDVEPHRNIEIAYTDSINTIFTTEISSRMSPNIDFYAWRELEDLPPPRTPHE